MINWARSPYSAVSAWRDVRWRAWNGLASAWRRRRVIIEVAGSPAGGAAAAAARRADRPPRGAAQRFRADRPQRHPAERGDPAVGPFDPEERAAGIAPAAIGQIRLEIGGLGRGHQREGRDLAPGGEALVVAEPARRAPESRQECGFRRWRSRWDSISPKEEFATDPSSRPPCAAKIKDLRPANADSRGLCGSCTLRWKLSPWPRN